MDGGVWERVSASFAQHSREDTECCAMHVSLCHMVSSTYLSRRVQCHVHSLKEGSLGARRFCTLRKQPRENTAVNHILYVCIPSVTCDCTVCHCWSCWLQYYSTTPCTCPPLSPCPWSPLIHTVFVLLLLHCCTVCQTALTIVQFSCWSL